MIRAHTHQALLILPLISLPITLTNLAQVTVISCLGYCLFFLPWIYPLSPKPSHCNKNHLFPHKIWTHPPPWPWTTTNTTTTTNKNGSMAFHCLYDRQESSTWFTREVLPNWCTRTSPGSARPHLLSRLQSTVLTPVLSDCQAPTGAPAAALSSLATLFSFIIQLSIRSALS